MRVAALLLAPALLLACETPAAFPVPAGPPLPVALDVEFPVYTMGTWAIDGFSESLATELAKYNMTVVRRSRDAHRVAEINLGVPGNRQVIEVTLLRDGVRTSAGRVRVPDLAPTTLDVAAQLVAPLIARQSWGLSVTPASPQSAPR